MLLINEYYRDLSEVYTNDDFKIQCIPENVWFEVKVDGTCWAKVINDNEPDFDFSKVQFSITAGIYDTDDLIELNDTQKFEILEWTQDKIESSFYVSFEFFNKYYKWGA